MWYLKASQLKHCWECLLSKARFILEQNNIYKPSIEEGQTSFLGLMFKNSVEIFKQDWSDA